MCDDSVVRSGVPVVHSIYGLPHTLNSVNYANSNALEKLLDLGDPRVFSFVHAKYCFKLVFVDYVSVHRTWSENA
jgi:geranylgeranyl pyrophosphate synthase